MCAQIVTGTPFNLQIWRKEFNLDVCDIRVQLRDVNNYETVEGGHQLPLTHKVDFVVKFTTIEKLVNAYSVQFVKKTSVGSNGYYSGRIIKITSLEDLIDFETQGESVSTQTDDDMCTSNEIEQHQPDRSFQLNKNQPIQSIDSIIPIENQTEILITAEKKPAKRK